MDSLSRLWLFLLIFFLPLVLYAKKTDIIILDNGDHLIGEIKYMEQAVLQFNTDAMSYVNIKWKKIRYVKSTRSFRVEKSDGGLLFGMIDTDTLTAELIVGVGDFAKRAPLKEVVAIREIEDTFRKGVTFSIDLGLAYTKASDVLQFNLSGDFGYRTLYWDRTLTFRSVLTSSGTDSSFSKNQNVDIQVYRLLKKRFFYTGFTSATQNTELSLKMRLALGLGVGRYLLRTNSMIFDVGIGAQGTREWKYGTTTTTNNIESVFTIDFEKFKLFSPKFDLDITAKAYPNITDIGRIRLDFTASMSWEIMKDFYWGINFYDNFDNKPVETDNQNSHNDYGITLTLTWKHY